MPDDSGRPDLTLIAEERAAEEREHEPGGGGEPEPPDPTLFRGLHYQDETGLHLLAHGLVDAADGTVLVKKTVGGKPVLVLEDMTETGGIPATQKGAPDGVATLDGAGLLPLAELPVLTAEDVGADAAGAASTAKAEAEAASAQGFNPISPQAGAYTAKPGEYIPVDISGGSVAVKLPAKPADKTRIAFKIVVISGTPGSTTLTINRSGEADVFNVEGGSTSLKLSAKFQGVVLQYKASTGIWYVQTTDTPLNEALGAALLGTDGTVGGPSGSALSPSVVSSSHEPAEPEEIAVSEGAVSRAVKWVKASVFALLTRTTVQAFVGPLSAKYLASQEDLNIRVNTSVLAPAEDWTKGSSVGDSGAAFAAAFTAVVGAEVSDPSGATSLKRGRRRIVMPGGSFYTAKPCSLMTAGGNRTIGLKYMGAGKDLTQIYFQPTVDNPRTFLDAEITGEKLRSETAAFTAKDVGHLVKIYQAGAGGGVFDTVITNYVNAKEVLVALSATTNVSGVACVVSPDACLLLNSDKHQQIHMQDLEFVGLQPTEAIPATTVADGTLGVTVADGAMAIGSKTLTSASAKFTPDMIGLTVTVAGGAVGKGLLTTTIEAYNSTSSVTLTAANGSGETLAGKSVSVFSNRLQLGRVLADGEITEGTKKLKSKTANFTAADLGTTIGIAGAGAAAALLITTIQSIVSSEEILTAQAAGKTVAAAQLTMAGRTLTGKHIGNQVEVTGAGAAGATLTATLRAIQLRDVNGVPSLEFLLSAPCATVVSGAATTFNCVANAVFCRSISNGGVVGPLHTNVRWAGAWAVAGYMLDGANQNAGVYFQDCECVERPGTFLHLMADPALSFSNDQQLDFVFDRGYWAFTYGDLAFFDGRGGYIKMRDGTQTLGEGFAFTEDTGGVLPVPTKGDATDPGGTWFKLRDRAAVQNHRVLVLDKTRFEERNDACCIRDIEWSLGEVVTIGVTDDSASGTSTNTFFSRMGYLGSTGPSMKDINCTWKGRHLIRFKNANWRFPHSIHYESCHLKEQLSAAQFLICSATDGAVTGEVSQPVVHFTCDTKTSTYNSNTGWQDNADTDLNWQTSNGSSVQRRWRRWGRENAVGIPGTGTALTQLVGYGALVTRLQLYIPVVAGQSTNEDWTVTITDNTPTTIHTFKAGEDGVAAGTKWNAGIFVEVLLAKPWLCTSNANRTLLAKVGGTGTTANLQAFVTAETMG